MAVADDIARLTAILVRQAQARGVAARLRRGGGPDVVGRIAEAAGTSRSVVVDAVDVGDEDKLACIAAEASSTVAAVRSAVERDTAGLGRLAKACGVSPSVVLCWESGEAMPTTQQALAWLSYLHEPARSGVRVDGS